MKDIIWFCVKWTLITCLVLISIGAPVRFFDLLYVGTFRYVMVDRHWLEDQHKHVRLELYPFSYEYKFPYMYLYGISGYTKVNTLPFSGQVEKVINVEYFNTNPFPGNPEYLEIGLDELKKRYGDSLVIYTSMMDVSSEDKKVFAQLQKQGERNFGFYKEVREEHSEDKEDLVRYRRRANGLMKLNRELEESMEGENTR